MAAASSRRPIPAIVFLLALSLLTAIVWWRVIHRASQDEEHHDAERPHCSQAKSLKLPAPSTITVTVLNGTGRYHLAATVSAQLRARGFKTAAPADDEPLTSVGEIRYTAKFAAAATVLHAQLPTATLKLLPTSSTAGVTLSVGAKYKALATPAQAKAAMAKASTSPAPTC